MISGDYFLCCVATQKIISKYYIIILMKDYYAILDLESNASQENIKEQYRFLVQAWHPDKFPTPTQKAKAEEKIKEINGAFEVLGNPAKRAQYDRERNFQSSSFAKEEKERRDREQAEAQNRYAEEQVRYAEEQRERQAQAEAARRRAEEEYQRREPISRRPGPVAPKGSELRLSLAPGVEMILVQIRAGEFLYGEQNWKVHLDEYRIGKYPVTNSQFGAFLRDTHYPYPKKIPEGKDDFPVVNVSWMDATAFCTWAAQASGHPIRLPSEAEWEKAARGTDGRIFPWGDQGPDSHLCNFNMSYHGITSIYRFSPQGESPYGCADMAGNVWEWTADWYSSSYLNQNPRSNPKGAFSGQYRVLRGGSWHDDGWYLRSSYRSWEPPVARNDSLGFRCAR
jgi:formylglycine-generating enzyme required for sulfatase activity/DnaJ-domain-containing protein 1